MQCVLALLLACLCTVSHSVSDVYSSLLFLFLCVQGDNEWKSNYGYISYFLVLLFWEVIPTYLIVIFFRLKLPCSCRCRRNVSVHT